MFQQSGLSSEGQQQLLAHFQIQQNICSQYIKMASSQLHFKEAQIISAANDLLEQISTKEKVKDLSEWDVFSTRDSVVIEEETSFNLSSISHQSRGKFIQRKSALTSRNTKQNQQSLNQCMVEVEKECSSKTVGTVKKVVEEYKKLKGRVFQLQKKEKGIKLKEKIIEQLQQKNMILTSKIEDLQQDIAKFKADYATLKTDNLQLTEQLRKKAEEANSERKIKLYEEIITHQQSSAKRQPRNSTNNHISYDVLNELIEQKENLLNMRYNEVKAIEQKIQRQLFSEQNRCVGCCQMLKKVKHSIIAYKKYLEQEGINFEQFVDKFKEKLLDQCLTSN